MTDPDDISVDDLVQTDEFESFRDEFESEIEDLRDDVAGGMDAEDVHNVADKTFMERLDHIVNEDCDTDACQRIRDQLSDGDHDHDDDDESDGDDGADADADDDADPDTDDTDDPADTSSGGSGDDDDDEGESSDSGGDDGETNIFGEPV